MHHRIIEAEIVRPGELQLLFTSGASVRIDLDRLANESENLNLTRQEYAALVRLADSGLALEWPKGPDFSAEWLYGFGVIDRKPPTGDLPEHYVCLLPEVRTSGFTTTAPSELSGEYLPLYPIWMQHGPLGRGFYYERADRLEGALGVRVKPTSEVPPNFMTQPIAARQLDGWFVIDPLDRRMADPMADLRQAVFQALQSPDWRSALRNLDLTSNVDLMELDRSGLDLSVRYAFSLAVKAVLAWRGGRWEEAAACIEKLNLNMLIGTDSTFTWSFAVPLQVNEAGEPDNSRLLRFNAFASAA